MSVSKPKRRDAVLKRERCERCFRQERKEVIPSMKYQAKVFTGTYRGVDCIFDFHNMSFRAIESTHFTIMKVWRICEEYFCSKHFLSPVTGIAATAAIGDNLLLFAKHDKLIVFDTVPRKEDQSCLSRPTCVLWCSFSPDSTRLATCTSDGFVNLWNVDLCQVYQRFRSNVETLSGACYWSDSYLFVYHLNRGIPSLSKYPIDEKLRIETTEKQLLPLCPVVNEHLHFPHEMVDFSYGYLIFDSFVKEPVKVFDVNTIGDPKPVVLPKIDSFMPSRVKVSAGGAFFLGTCYDHNKMKLVIWKKSKDDPALYKEHVYYNFGHHHAFFSIHDSKCVAFSSVKHCVVFDINAGSETHSIKLKNVPEGLWGADKMFCTNSVVIRVMPNLIQIYDLESREGLKCSFQRNLTKELVIRSKLSPQGNILAVPTLTGDMDFFQLCIPESYSVPNREKNNRMMTKHS